MSSLKEVILSKRPNLSKQSVATYSSILKNLFEKVFPNEAMDTEKFQDTKKILETLKKQEPTSRKTTLSALLIVTNNADYRKQMLEDIEEYNKQQHKQEANSKQSESWVEGEEIRKLLTALEKEAKLLYKKETLTVADLQHIQNYIILCLLGGVYIPPRRSKDFVEFKIKNINKNTDNYLHKDKLIFNSYKTAKTYGQQIVEIPKTLLSILKKWFKVNPTDYLLFDSNKNQLSNVKLNQRLNKLFGDKKISVNQLRHTFLSDKYQDSIKLHEDMAKDMQQMGSSTIQEKVYIKKKPKAKSFEI
jgi:integrase